MRPQFDEVASKSLLHLAAKVLAFLQRTKPNSLKCLMPGEILNIRQENSCAFHPFRRLPYDRSSASAKASSPQRAIYCFRFQFPVFSLFLRSASSSSFSLHYCHFHLSFFPHFSNVFQKAVPTPVVTNPIRLPSWYCMQDIPLPFDSK